MSEPTNAQANILNQDIKILKFDGHLEAALRRGGINQVEELQIKSPRQLLRFKGVSWKFVLDIIETLAEHELHLDILAHRKDD